MSVSKLNEVIGSSPLGFEDAARRVVERASRTLRGVTGIEVLEKQARVENGHILAYRVRVRLVFDVAPETVLHW